ncbi:MAG: hypothetical protein IJJ04_03780 [Clostridia bacterium]|nr:hypothetical protein [Clostridia bacterium]
MDEKKKKIEKLELDDLGRVAGGLSIGGRRFHSAVINEDLSKGDVDININVGGSPNVNGFEDGGLEALPHGSDNSTNEDAESANVELFPDENLVPFDQN